MKVLRCETSVCRCWLAALLVAGASIVMGAQGQAQPPVSTPPAAVDGFVPLSEAAPREVLPATPLVFYAYAFVWVALIGYVFLMWRRMARVEQDLAAVQRRLQDGAGGR